MISRPRWVLLICAVLAGHHRAFAEETPLLLAGTLFESPTSTLAPLLALRLPLQGGALTLAQLGWTSGVQLLAPSDTPFRWESVVAITPLRAHLSHNVYDPTGARLSSFDDTELRGGFGGTWTTAPFAMGAYAAFGKDWVSGLDAAASEALRSPYLGVQTQVSLESVRDESPLSSRISGVRIVGRFTGKRGSRLWHESDISASAGRTYRWLALRTSASAWNVSIDTPATDTLVGGSWDALGATALYGHSLGAFRLRRGLTGNLGADVDLTSSASVGVRASMLVGADRLRYGYAVVIAGTVSGVHMFVGVGCPDSVLQEGNWARLSLFGGASAALLFLP